jgi:hypothetical protein
VYGKKEEQKQTNKKCMTRRRTKTMKLITFCSGRKVGKISWKLSKEKKRYSYRMRSCLWAQATTSLWLRILTKIPKTKRLVKILTKIPNAKDTKCHRQVKSTRSTCVCVCVCMCVCVCVCCVCVCNKTFCVHDRHAMHTAGQALHSHTERLVLSHRHEWILRKAVS